MKKIIKNLILFLIICTCQNAFCYTLSSDELNKIVFNKINNETKKQLGEIDYKIKIQGNLTDINTNETTIPNIEISSLNNFTPISYRRISIKDSKGNILKTFPINVQIQIFKEVLIATDSISYNNQLNSTNTKLEKKEISKIYDKVLFELPSNSISTKNIPKNSIIQKNSIKQKALIAKNQNVDIIFSGSNIQIGIKGKALNDGAVGETILVRSDKYNKTYSAIVNSNSKVTVRI